MAVNGRVGNSCPGAHEAAAAGTACAGAAGAARPGGRGAVVRRDPRIAFRVVENQMSYAYLGNRLSNSAAENFPVFLADLCAARTRPTSRRRLGRCSRWPSPATVNSRARTRYSTMRRIGCSGAGTAATARRKHRWRAGTEPIDAERELPEPDDTDDDIETGIASRTGRPTSSRRDDELSALALRRSIVVGAEMSRHLRAMQAATRQNGSSQRRFVLLDFMTTMPSPR